MSYISDALRKSEQRRESARGLASVDRHNGGVASREGNHWLLVAVLVLLIAVLSLLAILVYKEFKSPVAAQDVSTGKATSAPIFSEAPPVANTRPLADEASDTPASDDTAALPPISASASDTSSATESKPEAPPLRHLGAAADGGLQNLTLQLLVYHADAKKRFVIINGQHLTEGQSLQEGPVVEQITPNGAVLNHNGSRFQIP